MNEAAMYYQQQQQQQQSAGGHGQFMQQGSFFSPDNLWSEEEHSRFLAALDRNRPPYDWNSIAAYVATRNASQVQQHANLYFMVLQRRLPYAAAMGQTTVRVTVRDIYTELGLYQMVEGYHQQQQMMMHQLQQQQQQQLQQQQQQLQQHQSARAAQNQAGSRGTAPGIGLGMIGTAPPVVVRAQTQQASIPASKAPPAAAASNSSAASKKRKLGGSVPTREEKKQVVSTIVKSEGNKPAQPPKTRPCGTLVTPAELEQEREDFDERLQAERAHEDDGPNKWEWARKRILGQRSYQFWFPMFRELIPLSKKEIADDLRVLKSHPELSEWLEESASRMRGTGGFGSSTSRPSGKRPIKPPTMSLAEESDDDSSGDKWVQCDRCLKWRKLPDFVDMRDIEKQKNWFCEYNPDKKRAKCSIAEPRQQAQATNPTPKRR